MEGFGGNIVFLLHWNKNDQDLRKTHISANGEITFALSFRLPMSTGHYNDKRKPVFPFRTSRPLWHCPLSAALYVKLSTNMVGGKQIILILLFLQPLLSQEACDPVFGDCGGDYEEECDDASEYCGDYPVGECDDVFGDGECGDYPAEPTEPVEPVEPCDAVFDDCPDGGPAECLSINEIDDTVFNR